MHATHYRVYTANDVTRSGHKAIRKHLHDAEYTRSIGKSLGISQWRVEVPHHPDAQHASINYVYIEDGGGRGNVTISINGHNKAVAYTVNLLRQHNKNNVFQDTWRRTQRTNPSEEQTPSNHPTTTTP